MIVFFLIAFWKGRKGEFVVNYTLIIPSFNPLITLFNSKDKKEKNQKKETHYYYFYLLLPKERNI